MAITATDGLVAFEGESTVLLALDEDVAGITTTIPVATSAAFRAIYGFYTYPEGKSIVITPGEIRSTSAEISYNDADTGESSEAEFSSVTSTVVKSGLAESTSGVIYLEVPVSDSTLELMTESESVGGIVIGASNSQYTWTLEIEPFRTQVPDSSFTVSDSANFKLGTEPIASGAGFFRKIIAGYTVNSDGYPSITQRHLGVIHLPQTVKYTAEMTIGGS